jgi:L-proline---[L-prolyl-carrier protein] ligase
MCASTHFFRARGAAFSVVGGGRMAEPGTLVDCVEAGAARVPSGKIAIAGEAGALSYGELCAGALGIATRLADAGIGRGARVGVWMEKSPAAVQALLGILRAGAAYVPLDPRSPPSRCRAAATDCGLAAIVVDTVRARLLPSLLEGQRPRLVLAAGDVEHARAVAAPHPVEALEAAAALPPEPLPAPRSDDLAYVLYGSGSNGAPKGIAHTHASAAASVRWMQRRFEIDAGDVLASHAPFHLDPSISDLYASLGAGASARVVSAIEATDAPQLVRMLGASGATVWYSPPSILAAMLEHGLDRASALRVALIAGEPFPIAQLRNLRRALPGATLASLFGPAETNVCTYHVLGPDAFDDPADPLPIGVACEGLETFVIDDEGRPVHGPGAAGTLCVKGPNVMLGYWNAPERTAAVLRPDPRGLPGVACCTGELVELLPRGGYAFRGRRDPRGKAGGAERTRAALECEAREGP